MSRSGVGGWLRQLDRDAADGRLWRRRVVQVPTLAAAGAVVGALLGFGVIFLLPETSTVRGPDGQELVLPRDNSGAVVVLPAAGLLVGLVLGVLAAVWLPRWRGRG